MNEEKFKAYHEFKDKFEDVHVYEDSTHFERKCVRLKDDPTQLYLYEFYEYTNFSGGEDEIYETFTKVEDLTDASTLNTLSDIRRTPYTRIMPDYSIVEG